MFEIIQCRAPKSKQRVRKFDDQILIDFYSRKDSILIQQPLSSNEKQYLLAFLETLKDEKYLTGN